MAYKIKTKNSGVFEQKKIALRFDISMLNMLIGYLFKKSSQITRRSLVNMKKLFDIVDDSVYDENEKMEARLYVIKRALKAKVDEGFENEDAIINYCKKDVYDKNNEEIINNIEIYKRINYEEIKYINKAIQDRLQYAYLYNYKDAIYDSIERLDSGDYDSFASINTELTGICSKLLTHIRQAKSIEDGDTFSLDDENFEAGVTDMVNKIHNPSRVMKTGIKRLNSLLSPGYIGGRLYIYMGLPAGFKSGILLKTCRDIKRYNRGFVGKKPGKRPCVLLVTMENTVEETLERLFNMTVTNDDIRNYTAKQVIKLLKEKGEIVITNTDNIDIVIKYKANRTIDTSDLKTIIETLDDEGKEVIALVLDYIKRIKPAEPGKDEKEELKNVTNELKTIAKELDIPVITAHQLNRSGAASVDAAMQSNKEDLARFVGRANVGTAWEVVENCDWAGIINVEKKRDTNTYYLTFKRIKLRYKDLYDDGLGYFNHPFEVNNKMMLIDDCELEESLSEDSLTSDFDGVDLSNKKGNRNATERDVVDSDEGLFDFSKSINSR